MGPNHTSNLSRTPPSPNQSSSPFARISWISRLAITSRHRTTDLLYTPVVAESGPKAGEMCTNMHTLRALSLRETEGTLDSTVIGDIKRFSWKVSGTYGIM